MKKFIFITAFLYCYCLSWSQIGIGTTNPLGALHIDTGRDNPGSMQIPSTIQQANDVVVSYNTTDGDALIGIGTIPSNTSSAQLELKATNKAILLNNVKLTSTNDIVTVPNPKESTMVYNTTTAGSYPYNIQPSLCYFNGLIWSKMETGTKSSAMNFRLLQKDALTPQCLNITDGKTKAATADFGNMLINEAGAYTFELRLYGIAKNSKQSSGTSIFDRVQAFVYLVKKGPTGLNTVLDMIPINTVAFSVNDAFTYTAIIRGEFDVNDQAVIKVAYTGTYAWSLTASPNVVKAARTSLIYWK